MNKPMGERCIVTNEDWEEVWNEYVRCIKVELDSYDKLVEETGVDFSTVDFSCYKPLGATISNE